ncbi:MAG: aminotransferase class V-fold PLP-dependent enzyme [Vicinamibacterales bacterium]
MSYDRLFALAQEHARAFLATLPDRFVNARTADPVTGDGAVLGDPVPAEVVLDSLARLVEDGSVATPGPRYFGFVTGGSYPVAVAADWLVSVWDQNAGLHALSPAIAHLEDVTAGWLLDLLDLPRGASVGFVTGATMANVTALAAARHEVLRRAGWDVEANGLQGAPRLTVVVGAGAHASIDTAARLLGFGTSNLVRVAADGQGRMLPDALEAAMAHLTGPVIVCLQAGHVNTGAFDPFIPLIEIAGRRGAWVHVDGAFGLWARAVEDLRHLADGVERADSWGVDAHKWLNVPYDSGIAIVAQPAAHRASMAQRASYLLRADGERRDGMDWTPEASRRARAVPLYAVLKALGRGGIAALIAGNCARAREMAERLRQATGITILNDVVLNQVLVRVRSRSGANVTPATIARVQQDGVCWVGGTTWDEEPAMRISISNWSTTAEDIERSAASIAAAAVTAAQG